MLLPAVNNNRARPASIRLIDFPKNDKNVIWEFISKMWIYLFDQYLMYLPSEFKQSFGGLGNAILWPREEMKLRDGSSLASAQIFEIKWADQVIIAPDVFRDQMNFIDVVQFRTFFWPVPMTHRLSFLSKPS